MTARPDALVVRDASPSDAAAVAALLAELGYPTDAATAAHRLESLAALGDRALIALDGDDALGLVTVHRTPVLHRPSSVGRITALVVSASARGRGVGRALVDAAERILMDAGCEMVEVTSNQKRTDAHAFYERLGYSNTSFKFARRLERDTAESPS